MAAPSSHSVSNLELQGDLWYLDSTCTAASTANDRGHDDHAGTAPHEDLHDEDVE